MKRLMFWLNGIGLALWGYATLAGLAYTPDLFAAGVSFVGLSNIVTVLI